MRRGSTLRAPIRASVWKSWRSLPLWSAARASAAGADRRAELRPRDFHRIGQNHHVDKGTDDDERDQRREESAQAQEADEEAVGQSNERAERERNRDDDKDWPSEHVEQGERREIGERGGRIVRADVERYRQMVADRRQTPPKAPSDQADALPTAATRRLELRASIGVDSVLDALKSFGREERETALSLSDFLIVAYTWALRQTAEVVGVSDGPPGSIDVAVEMFEDPRWVLGTIRNADKIGLRSTHNALHDQAASCGSPVFGAGQAIQPKFRLVVMSIGAVEGLVVERHGSVVLSVGAVIPAAKRPGAHVSASLSDGRGVLNPPALARLLQAFKAAIEDPRIMIL